MYEEKDFESGIRLDLILWEIETSEKFCIGVLVGLFFHLGGFVGGAWMFLSRGVAWSGFFIALTINKVDWRFFCLGLVILDGLYWAVVVLVHGLIG